MVGPKPRRSTVVRIITAQVGSEVRYQNGRDSSAEAKNNQSAGVMLVSVFFARAMMAIKLAMAPDTPMGQAPIPPLASSWAKKTINVVIPQITQENTWGLVLPVKVAMT